MRYQIAKPVTIVTMCFLGAALSFALLAQNAVETKFTYTKTEYQIPMRDGVNLFTSVYIPNDTSVAYPILMTRTPYSVAPYGSDAFPRFLGPSSAFAQEGYIFVYQDVRGRYKSEGEFKWMTPYIPNKQQPSDVDETTDTNDTIEWLLKNIPNNNGRVGMWGISYPGFYTAAALADPHPALKAASPQAPMADNYLGDDIHHNGAFWLPHIFNFISWFGQARSGPTADYPPGINFGSNDGYSFFLEMGALANANNKYFHHQIRLWDEWMEHGNYDSYWKAQNVPQHLKKIDVSVMTVGGWFDAEDLQGTLRVYEALEAQNPNSFNVLVMGPWFHGGWAGGNGNMLGNIDFGSDTSRYYRQNLELPFFNYYLKQKGVFHQPEAYVFETGSNQWKTYDHWPPRNERSDSLYLQPNGKLSFTASVTAGSSTFDEYVSDPAKPVPYIEGITMGMAREYMDDDQRFVASRPDVLVYRSDILDEDVTVAGPVDVSLVVSTSGTDSDFVVKLIDVIPDGYQMLVRGEPFRAKYRKSFSTPEPMTPNQPTEINYQMPDINHTFLKGHRIMVQVQSSWFPLMDRNPQRFVNIYAATDSDFQKATERIYHSATLRSQLKFRRIIR